MSLWHDISIRHKLAGLVIVACGLAVLFASVAFYSYQRKTLHETYLADLESFAAVIANHATAAMSFDDKIGARRILQNVMVKSDIIGVYLCTADGEPYTEIVQEGNPYKMHAIPDMKDVGHRLLGNAVEVYHPIRHEGQLLGAITLQASLSRLEAQLRQYALWSLLFAAVSLGLAFVISKRLQTLIFAPLSRLSHVMEQVSSADNYKQRVERESNDELGQLIDGFNHMLGAIDSRDTELKRTGVRLNYMATHDSLTGLPNRNMLNDRLATYLREIRGQGGHLAVLFLDLDRFKAINDTLGHDVGDHVLTVAASRLRSALKERDLLARIGGDEFVALISDFASHDQLARIAHRLRESLLEPFTASGHELFLDVSIGISVFPDDGQDGAALLKQADMAMYQAKQKGGNGYSFYDRQMSQKAQYAFSLETDLRHAIERDELMVHYQPQVSLDSRELIGYEALIRWQHPTRGWISPMDFIPVAEQSGMILPIGAWVLEQACQQNQLWLSKGLSRVPMAVNLSPRQFRDPQLATLVTEILEKTGLPAEYLELELTESALFDNLDMATETMTQLRQMGISIALDDFGTGYSSLSNVRNFPLTKLKIDRSFVQKIGTETGDLALVESIILLGKAMGIRVIAEGVSEESHLKILKDQGCREGQGYYFGRPVPAAQVEALLLHGASMAQGELKTSVL